MQLVPFLFYGSRTESVNVERRSESTLTCATHKADTPYTAANNPCAVVFLYSKRIPPNGYTLVATPLPNFEKLVLLASWSAHPSTRITRKGA